MTEARPRPRFAGAEEVVGGGAGEGQGHALLAGDLDGEGDVLGGPLEEERGVVVVALEQLGHGAQMCAGGGDAHDLVGALLGRGRLCGPARWPPSAPANR